MPEFNMFGNSFWPTGCIYNVEGKEGGSCGGGADVEHRPSVSDEELYVLYDKILDDCRNDREEIDQALSDYYEYTKTRVSRSD